MKTIKTDVENVTYVVASKDKLFYPYYTTRSIYCCDLGGRQLWIYTNNSLTYILGVSVDNFGNVLVASKAEHKVVYVRHDGTESRTLLTKKDKILYPNVVSYNHDKSCLVVGTEIGRYSVYRLA